MSLPRPREIVILILLLFALVWTTTRSQLSNSSSREFHTPVTPMSRVPLSPRRKISETKVVAHTPGWTVFDNLVLYNGTIYIVSDLPTITFPDLPRVFSKAHFISLDLEAELARQPTPEDISIINTTTAAHRFGSRIRTFEGVTWLANDPPQYITHYYHFCAELFFGFWRAHTSLANSSDIGSLPPPNRILFPHLDSFHWRDYASLNQLVLRASFPGLSLQFLHDWRDYIEMKQPILFERVIIADRSAAMTGYNYARYQRTAGTAFSLPLPIGVGPVGWWSSIRRAVVGMTGADPAAGNGTSTKPVITYLSRQKWGRRMLRASSHDALIAELKNLQETHGYEVNIAVPEEMSPYEQIRLMARTTILMGVHGNGLTGLLWMNPTPRTTVMEFFYPSSFAHDYEYTTRALGMKHYGFWDGKYFTSPGLPTPFYGENFHGNDIPLDAAAVAKLCVHILDLNEEVDD